MPVKNIASIRHPHKQFSMLIAKDAYRKLRRTFSTNLEHSTLELYFYENMRLAETGDETSTRIR